MTNSIARFNFIYRVTLVLALLAAMMWPATPSTAFPLAHLHPLVAKLAVESPERTVAVIVQKAETSNRAEELVAQLGGTVTQSLRIINAFVAEMQAGAALELAASPTVRWVSLDASTRSATLSALDVRVAASGDDAEEEGAGSVHLGPGGMYLTSSDLEFMQDLDAPSSGMQTIGLRFNGIGLPQGATITNAYLRFRAIAPDEGNSNTNPANLTIQGQAADNAPAFTSAANNLSSRPRTTASVQWLPSAWSAGATYDSPSLTAIVQEIVNRSAWASGNSLVFIIRCTDGAPATDCGSRSADSWDGNATTAPLLHIEWDNAATPPPSPSNPMFTTWATAISTAVKNNFTNNTLMVDSALGPNGTFGMGSASKGAFAGFAGETSPGNAITKVEVVLYGYTPAVLASAQDPIITAWVGGKTGKSIVLNHHAFDTYIGAANAGWVYLDITSTRTWKWTDFDNGLQIVIDQGKFKSTTQIYYDAVGLRVTSMAGADASGDSGGDTSALATLNSGAQVNFYNQVIRASDLWNAASKLQGKGVTVAVVDSGVYKTKDLDKRVRANVNFDKAYHDAADRYGHGTFVAGIVAGSGSQSGNKYMGVAPRADILNVRVSDDQGMSTESDVVSALQWVLDNKAKYNIRVVNLSLNSSVAQSYHTSPLDAACEILWFNGIVVVVSAGNNGTATLFPPANDPFVITVGATDDKGTLAASDDGVATFSAYGLTESGFAKPDLVAPGRNIIGLLPENDKLTMSAARVANRIDKTYFKMSGTSVSAPMVAGAVTLLLQDEPNLTPDQVKYRLLATANKNWPGYNAAKAGAGYLDVYAAVHGATVQSANTGLPASQLLWTGSEPVNWNSVNWESANWESVNWESVNWESVNWESVNWESDYWGP
jgi:serine protease AprX